MKHTNQPYVYCWSQNSTGFIYVGIRFAKDCYPDEPISSYIATQKDVVEGVTNNPYDWNKSIIAIGTKQEVIRLERAILRSLRGDKKCYNKNMKEHNSKFHGTKEGGKAYWQRLSPEDRSKRNKESAKKVDHHRKNVKRAETLKALGIKLTPWKWSSKSSWSCTSCRREFSSTSSIGVHTLTHQENK